MITLNTFYNPLYYSYYLYGLLQICAKNKIHADNMNVPSFDYDLLSMKINEKKCILDACDSSDINSEAMKWADLYCKVNVNDDECNANEKLLILGPGFGIRCFFNFWGNMRSILKNWTLLKKNSCIQNYLRKTVQIHFTARRGLRCYKRSDVDENYIFILCSLWAPEDKCNEYRKKFITAAKGVEGVTFEGGFAPPYREDMPHMEPFMVKSSCSFREYIRKTAKSMCVFNTPAVLNCHGWKLGEYMFLGKAIISTRLTRALPAPLNDGEHLLYTDGSREDIQKKIIRLRNNPEQRKILEKNVATYFDQYLHPAVVAKRIVSASMN